MRTPAFVVLGALFLASCAQLPGSGPSTNAFVEASAQKADFRYELIDVDQTVVSALRSRGTERLGDRFGSTGGASETLIGVGDFVTVTIWEAGTGGLFSGAVNALGVGTTNAVIPEQQVSARGTITIPYAGSIVVKGRTADEVKAAIEAQLAGKAIEPQVLVSVTRNLANAVTLTGDLTGGGRIPLSNRGTRILDVLSGATTSAPASEMFVQLTRGSRSARVPLQVVQDDPAQNVYLRSDDVVTVTREPQTFTAFGATTANAQIPFDARGISLAEAIAKAGGIQDFRADPAGVFILRYEPADFVRQIAPSSQLAASSTSVPVIYRFNLRDPAGLFLARSFSVKNKDMVYIANANLNELQKFLILINSVAQPVATYSSVKTAFD